MTGTETSTELQFEPAGPGPWSLDPVHFPRPVTRYWAETHPAPFVKGTHDFATFYGMLIDGLQTSYVNGFAFNQPVPVADEEVPARFARATEVFEGKALARPASRLGRGSQAGRDREAPGDPGCRPGRALRRGARRLSRALPRPPRGDDHAAHALHGERGRPDRGLPRARRRLDRASARRAARADAGLGAGVRRRFGPARAARRRVRRRPRRARSCSSRRAIRPRRSRRCAPGTARRARRSPAISTWSGTGSSTASTSPSRPRSSCPTCCCARCGSPPKARAPTTPASRSGSPMSAARSPRSTAPSSTSCSGRRG